MFAVVFLAVFPSVLVAAQEYSGVYLCKVRGDDTRDDFMKIEQNGADVTAYLRWALPDPFSGTATGSTLNIESGTIIITFDASGETFAGTWTHGSDSGTVTGERVDPDMWRIPFLMEADETKGFSLPYVLFVPYTVENKNNRVCRRACQSHQYR